MRKQRSLTYWFITTTLVIFVIGYIAVIAMGGNSVSKEDTSSFVDNLLWFRLGLYSLLTAGCFLWGTRTKKGASMMDDQEDKEILMERAESVLAFAWKVPILLGLYEVLFAQKLWM